MSGSISVSQTMAQIDSAQGVGAGSLIPGTMFDINGDAFKIIAGHNSEATPENINGKGVEMAAVHGNGDSSSGGGGGSTTSDYSGGSSGSSGGGSSSGGGGSSIPMSSVGNLQPSSTPSGGASLFSGMGAGGGLFGSV